MFALSHWLKSPPDRDVITRWTVGGDGAMRHELALPAPSDPDHFEFLALGDTGDSEASGPQLSPQAAVAEHLAADAALPGGSGRALLVLHTGDVVYMTGERRLYDCNFRRPYAAFLTPASTVDHLTFRLPFLPVPGNHDYYDLGGWGIALARVPFLGTGLRALASELFAFSLPEGGSGMGRAYMQAFVDLQADTSREPLPYRLGESTRLPNRYYRFRVGSVDFFALDSNTLDVPPSSANGTRVRMNATEQVRMLEARARALDRQLRRDQLALDRWRATAQEEAARDPVRLSTLRVAAEEVGAALAGLEQALTAPAPPDQDHDRETVAAAARRWAEARGDLGEAADPEASAHALEVLEEASDDGCAALRAVEGCLAVLPEGPQRADLLAARARTEQALQAWQDTYRPQMPEKLCARIRNLAEAALDVERELARERHHARSRPEDHDAAQLRWLDAALAEAVRERPDGWRVLYLHHPLYSTIANHCERPDIQGVRDNLLPLLRDRVHLVLSGHSHAFEWSRSAALPHVGLFVTGGGGQLTLRSSLLQPGLLHRHRDRYEALRRAGVTEHAVGGRGPAAADGESGPLYHYLRITVTPQTLIVSPIGVRRLRTGYRREAPMPVFHAPELPESRPPWRSRRLEAVEVRRDRPPRACWA
jgi:3',5'-cyclic AMP phosphodiesterase CpdA